jgi:hypothetical protein
MLQRVELAADDASRRGELPDGVSRTGSERAASTGGRVVESRVG